MNYIVVDLEWNQPMSFDSHVYREVGDRLIFEMIQIGAVKLVGGTVADSMSVLVNPKQPLKPKITEITGISYESWHFRYVGRYHAYLMNEKDMCLEEYVEYLAQQA